MQPPAHLLPVRVHVCRVLVVAVCSVLPLAGCGERDPTGPAPGAYVAPETYEIEITGHDFRWRVRYPGLDGRLGTADDAFGERHVHVPSHARVRLHLRSDDYVYGFTLPHLDLKEIAVPDLHYTLEFEGAEAGTYELRGHQMCGYTHPELIGTLVVETPEDFQSTLDGLRANGS